MNEKDRKRKKPKADSTSDQVFEEYINPVKHRLPRPLTRVFEPYSDEDCEIYLLNLPRLPYLLLHKAMLKLWKHLQFFIPPSHFHCENLEMLYAMPQDTVLFDVVRIIFHSPKERELFCVSMKRKMTSLRNIGVQSDEPSTNLNYLDRATYRAFLLACLLEVATIFSAIYDCHWNGFGVAIGDKPPVRVKSIQHLQQMARAEVARRHHAGIKLPNGIPLPGEVFSWVIAVEKNAPKMPSLIDMPDMKDAKPRFILTKLQMVSKAPTAPAAQCPPSQQPPGQPPPGQAPLVQVPLVQVPVPVPSPIRAPVLIPVPVPSPPRPPTPPTPPSFLPFPDLIATQNSTSTLFHFGNDDKFTISFDNEKFKTGRLTAAEKRNLGRDVIADLNRKLKLEHQQMIREKTNQQLQPPTKKVTIAPATSTTRSTRIRKQRNNKSAKSTKSIDINARQHKTFPFPIRPLELLTQSKAGIIRRQIAYTKNPSFSTNVSSIDMPPPIPPAPEKQQKFQLSDLNHELEEFLANDLLPSTSMSADFDFDFGHHPHLKPLDESDDGEKTWSDISDDTIDAISEAVKGLMTYDCEIPNLEIVKEIEECNLGVIPEEDCQAVLDEIRLSASKFSENLPPPPPSNLTSDEEIETIPIRQYRKKHDRGNKNKKKNHRRRQK